MSDIFISYASADRQVAKNLSRRLEQEGWTVWWDRDIAPGKSYARVIEKALISARCVVVLWSETSRNSDWVHNEAAEGKRRGILVPARIEKTTPPFEFKRIQAANLVGWEEEEENSELPQFLKAIADVLSKNDQDEENTSPIPPTAAGNKKNPDKKSEFQDDEQTAPHFHSWWRLPLLIVLLGLALMALFKAVFPQTPTSEALTAIFILSCISAVIVNYLLNFWFRLREKNRRKNAKAP